MGLFRAVFAGLCAALLLGTAAVAAGKVLVRVNGAEITELDLEMARTEFAEQLAGIPAGKRRRELLLFVIQNQLLAEAALRENLDGGAGSGGLTQYYRRRVLHDAYYERKISAAVPESAVRKRYDEEIASTGSMEQIRARQIVVATEEEARDIIERLSRGADFAEMAMERSTGRGAERGGDLGYFSRGEMDPEFEAAAFALAENEISDPVQTKFGWHVIEVRDKRSSGPPAFEDVKEELRARMVREKAKRIIGALERSARIDILDPEVKKALEGGGGFAR